MYKMMSCVKTNLALWRGFYQEGAAGGRGAASRPSAVFIVEGEGLGSGRCPATTRPCVRPLQLIVQTSGGIDIEAAPRAARRRPRGSARVEPQPTVVGARFDFVKNYF